MGFQQGLSGLNSASKFLDVVGNNVANANTVGYKGSRAEFADIYANTLASTSVQVGIGGRTSNVAQQFAQGNISSTNNPLDIAIQGNGFFRLIDPSGSYSYSRNGQFQLDRDGYIVNNGQKLAGYIANENNQLLTGSSPEAIQVRTSNIGARATGGSTLANAGLTVGMNLDAREDLISRGTQTVSVTGAQLQQGAGVGTQIDYQTRVADPTGQFHLLNVRLINVGPATWSVQTQLDGAGSFTSTSTPLVFTPGGQLQSGATQSVSYPIGSPAPAYGSTPFNFNLNFSGIQETAAPVNGTISVSDVGSSTTVAVYNSNLDANDPVTTPHVYNTTFRDPNGVTHTLAITLTKAATNTWTATYDIDGAGPVSTLPDGVTPIPAVVFNTNGQIISDPIIPATYTYPAGPFGEPGGPMNFNLSLQGVTQRAGVFTAGSVETRSSPAVNPTDPNTFTHSTSADVYDSQGVRHTLTFYMTKVGVNAWEVQTSFDGATPVLQPGYVTFDSAGKMNGGTSFAYTSPIPSPSGAQTPLAFTTFLTGTTQFGNQFGVNELSQDGYADGNITGLSIGKDGLILGRYSNGQNRTIGQITLFNFANPQGLQPLGDNRWAESYASNQARIGTPGTSDFGALQSGAVEDSNIDLTKELVDMITAQRSYQANAQTIKTQDQLLQTMVNLR